MKKILFGILTFLGIGLSFCSAFDLTTPGQIYKGSFGRSGDLYTSCWDSINITYDSSCVHCFGFYYLFNSYGSISDSSTVLNISSDVTFNPFCSVDYGYILFGYVDLDSVGNIYTLGGGSSTSDIDIYYNNGNSVENITCDGTQAIQINGLSTITSTNTFTPYFNISYTDEDNQSLIESYSKDILYLENGQFKKTYTGNNDWILTVQGGSENSFSGYLPTFEITGGIEEVSESGNIFNNFAENSVKFTLSNIPSYIQYVILLFILFFILGFIRKFRRK